jgi:putative colanic acid biosynthesis glycosyltransferase
MKLSIVTAHLDDLDGLRRTARSVAWLLRACDAQWVLVDGGTAQLRDTKSEFASQLREMASPFVCEPDEGIYSAMNKGTGHSSGDYVLYLNAGDELHPEFSPHGIEDELGGSQPGMIWGTCWERFPSGAQVKVRNRSPRLAWYGMPVNHQNVLFRRDLLGLAPYNPRYRYCADYDLVSRLLHGNEIVHRTPQPIAVFEKGGTSARNFDRTMEEEERLRTIHFGVSRPVSRAITLLKKLTHRLGKVPALRRLLRKWV